MPEREEVDLPEPGWVSLGATPEGERWSGWMDLDPIDETEPVPYAPSPALSRPFGPAHRYPLPRPHRGPVQTWPRWTIGDALDQLSPRPNRRTLSRWLRGLEPVGTRALPQGGPPARLYWAHEVRQLHAKWAKTISV